MSKKTRWRSIESSNIAACLYFRKTQLLLMEFHSGKIYGYSAVPWSRYLGFRRALSQGAYFARYIRDREEYPCQELPSADVLAITTLR